MTTEENKVLTWEKVVELDLERWNFNNEFYAYKEKNDKYVAFIKYERNVLKDRKAVSCSYCPSAGKVVGFRTEDGYEHLLMGELDELDVLEGLKAIEAYPCENGDVKYQTTEDGEWFIITKEEIAKKLRDHIFLAVIGLKECDIERFRDVYLSKDQTQIVVCARTGGGNREDYPNKNLTSNFYYEKDEDEDDSTYANYYFTIPPEIKEDLLTMSNNIDMDRFREWEKMYSNEYPKAIKNLKKGYEES